ncbi:inter-alpha-trypsin inhibitor heavy chain H6-like [Chanos chanos]|uniref:Inter-alpha-trypsin inhibitor heavy chain H6-like n=1 Tax=Chanos chanos TaxID=29144 RepID=A0A6J2UWD4_CHACN|nr:inter-alpha-trypsin inhibitor heavy chain H6 [Chanos chanos]
MFVFFLQRVRRSGPDKSVLEVTDFHVSSTVVSRYARTTVVSTVRNHHNQSQEANFEVDLPSTAFISNFTITSGGTIYVAQVKEKEVAKKIYDSAKKEGKTAGLVAKREKGAENFSVSVSVAPGTSLSFTLTYEELLARRLGHYELVLGLRPTQPVQNLTVDVSISERTGISFIQVLPLRTSQHLSNTLAGESVAPPSTQIERIERSSVRVQYSPSVSQQISFSPSGLNADFVIHYDVDLTDLIGDVQIFDGYFVHYFAPRGLPIMPKEVIFVIDVSGSMDGIKMKQTKEAMKTILNDLHEHDFFNIITFSSSVQTWQREGTVPASRENVELAKTFVKRMKAKGMTDINSAVLHSAKLLSQSARSSGSKGVPMVIFLTDGEATEGVKLNAAILRNARDSLGSASLFGLAFGRDADFALVRQLSLENRGVARRIYEDADAKLQLKGFYDEVASPLLSDVQLSYRDDQAFDVTRAFFPNYFQGSELVVAGRVQPKMQELSVSLTASDTQRGLMLQNSIPVSQDSERRDMSPGMNTSSSEDVAVSHFVQRLWAYFTIKDLLERAQNTSDSTLVAELKKKATELSIKYNFVTPVTSLVVVKPEMEEAKSRDVNIERSKPQSRAVPKHPKKVFASSVDGDPHFVVHLPKLDQTLCFTIDGQANDIPRLLEDPERGIVVDGRLMWAPPEVGFEDHNRTYFDQIVVSMTSGEKRGVVVTITLDSVKIDVKGEGPLMLQTGRPGVVERHDFVVEIDEHLRCWVDLGKEVQFLVLFHHYRHPTYLQLAHLGFYIANGKGLSLQTQGLLGQFQHADIKITKLQTERLDRDIPSLHVRSGSSGTGRHTAHTDALAEGVLRRGTVQVPVTLRRKNIKDTVWKRHPEHCWEVARADVDKILLQPYQSYIQ